jgi:hypothetical protein
MTGIDPAGRARAYALLARLIDGERAAIEAARDTPPIGEWLGDRSTSELMAAHYRAFGLDAFPRAGVYATGLVRDGDELGTALAALGRLEAAGDRRGCSEILAGLLAWLPPFAVAIRRVEVAPWPAIAKLAIDLVAGHAAELEVDPAPPPPGRFEIDDGAGLRQLAGALCHPADCGALITSGALRRIGRGLDLPVGFGSRRQRLQQLFESAASLGQPGPALARIAGLFNQTVADLDHLAATPGMAAAVMGWRARAEATRDSLVDMHERLRR